MGLVHATVMYFDALNLMASNFPLRQDFPEMDKMLNEIKAHEMFNKKISKYFSSKNESFLNRHK